MEKETNSAKEFYKTPQFNTFVHSWWPRHPKVDCRFGGKKPMQMQNIKINTIASF